MLLALHLELLFAFLVAPGDGFLLSETTFFATAGPLLLVTKTSFCAQIKLSLGQLKSYSGADKSASLQGRTAFFRYSNYCF